MKVALLVLTRGGVSGGFRKYLDRLVPLLRQRPEVERLDVFVPPEMAREGDRTWPANDERTAYRELRRAVAVLQPDVVFIPTARMLRVGSIPVVTMVRNMEPLEVPFGGNRLAEGVKNLVRAWAAKSACRKADRVIAVSDHVRRFLSEEWAIPDERIGLVPHGVDPAGPLPDEIPAALAPLHGTPFLFTAGSIRPARGLEDVVVALASLSADVRLVIAGAVDRGAEAYDRRIRELARRHGIESRIIRAGKLAPSSMSWCYRHAAFFVMTSRAEACPNVVLEAMAEGAVSVSTDHAPMPEFFGDAAVYYAERSAADLAARLAEALAWPEATRDRLRQRARERAGGFTWEATARATVSELQRALK